MAQLCQHYRAVTAMCVSARGLGVGIPQQLVCKYFGFHLLGWNSSSGVIHVSRALTISLFAAEYCPLIWVNAEPSPGPLLSSSCMLIHGEDCVLRVPHSFS